PMEGSTALGSTGPGSGGASGSGGGGSPGGAPTEPTPVARVANRAGARSRRGRRVAVALAVSAVVLLLVGGGVALSARSGSDEGELVVAESPVEEEAVVEEVAPDPGPGPEDAPSGNDGAEPGEPSSTTTQPTTTTVPDPPIVESLTLRPATDKPPTYEMADAPVLTWSVTGADAVEVWLWTDTGSGPQRTRLLSSDPNGSMPICPGTVAGTRCTSPPATYLFVVEAENEAGRVVSSDAVPAPRFIVYTIIS
ncbi:MAG TPA: hypothetical protein VIY72_12310, partial [Acidimicrobiales bacterium]